MESPDIKGFRESNKINQQELADFLGVSRVYISQIETGRSKLSESKVYKLLYNDRGWDTSFLKSELPTNNVVDSVTIEREAWDVIKSQQNTIEKQQDMLQQMIDMLSKRGAQREDPAECVGAAGA